MDGKRFIRSIELQNFLSYGNDSSSIELRPLNVIIGANASGKSNLIEAIGLLQAAPRELPGPIREGGGIAEWLWKGKAEPVAKIEATIDYPQSHLALRYRVSFARAGQRFEIVDEAVENESALRGDQDVYFFYRYQNGHPVLNVRTSSEAQVGTPDGRTPRTLRREDINLEQSILSQRKDPDQYPELTYLANQFAEMRLYREWNLGRYTPLRLPQPPDLPQDFLLEDAKNLGLILNDLEHLGRKPQIVEQLKQVYEQVEDVTVRFLGGTVQIFVREKGLHSPIPATRLSDGTLRYLCLLAILLHPAPPPLVCIEEPELGLHPDILPTVARLLIEAKERTQLIVTTHSDVLVSALTDIPEAVIVCERDEFGTQLNRLNSDRLKAWLENYQLGQLWTMGEIGGTRW